MPSVEQVNELQSHIDFCAEHDRGVYFIQGVDGGPIKIGRSRKGGLIRLRELQCGSPVELRIIGWIPSWGMELEYGLHQCLSKWRLRGEWFEPSPEVLEIIDVLKRFSSLAS